MEPIMKPTRWTESAVMRWIDDASARLEKLANLNAIGNLAIDETATGYVLRAPATEAAIDEGAESAETVLLGPFDVKVEAVEPADSGSGSGLTAGSTGSPEAAGSTSATKCRATIYDSSWEDHAKRPAGTIKLSTSSLSLEYRPKVMSPVEPPADPFDRTGSEEWTDGDGDDPGSTSQEESFVDVAGKTLYLVFGLELGASFGWEIVARVEAVESEAKLSCYGMTRLFRWVRLATINADGELTYKRTPADVSDALALYTGEFMLWSDGTGRKMLLNGNKPDDENCGYVTLGGDDVKRYGFPAELNLQAAVGSNENGEDWVRVLLRCVPEDETPGTGEDETPENGEASETEESGTKTSDGWFYLEVVANNDRFSEIEENDEIAYSRIIGCFREAAESASGSNARVNAEQEWTGGRIDIPLARWW